MDDDIKRCPFCGGSPELKVWVTMTSREEDHIDFIAQCGVCKVEKRTRLIIHGTCGFIDVLNAMEEVESKWNQRSDRE